VSLAETKTDHQYLSETKLFQSTCLTSTLILHIKIDTDMEKDYVVYVLHKVYTILLVSQGSKLIHVAMHVLYMKKLMHLELSELFQ